MTPAEPGSISSRRRDGGPDRADCPSQTGQAASHWRLPPGQRLLFEDFDDGIVMFDAGVGATHLLNASAAETLAIVQEQPGLVAVELRARLLERLGIAERELPLAAFEELLRRLEDLNLVRAYAA